MRIKILDLKGLEKKLYKHNKDTIIHCHGVFDILHYQHINYLSFSKSKGDVLFVTITADKYVNKGFKRPFFHENIRAESLAALAAVDYVFINESPTSVDIIKKIKPHFYVKGVDYKKSLKIDKNLRLEKKAVESIGGKLIFSGGDILSSSNIINNNTDIFNIEQKSFLKKIKKKYSFDKINELINKFSFSNICLIGEAIIDEYIFCDSVGKSGKEPILINKKIESKKYAGGIIAVANHLSTFCKSITIFTYLGDNNSEINFIGKNIKKNIKLKFIKKKNSPTINKSRFVDNYTKNKIIGLYDLNEEKLNKENEREFLSLLDKEISKFDMTLVVDYDHGLITNKVANLIQKKSKYLSLNSQLNSLNLSYYSLQKFKKADYVCIHEGELKNAFKSKDENIKILMKQLQIKMKVKKLVITKGRNGSMSLSKNVFYSCPAFADKVVDRIGAGDTMIAVTSIFFRYNLDEELVLFIGNIAAANTIKHMGTGNNIEKEQIVEKIRYLLK